MVDEVDDPAGKWPPVLGNVLVLESSYMAQLLQEQIHAIIDLVDNFGLGSVGGTGSIIAIPGLATLPTLGQLLLPTQLAAAREFADTFDQSVMDQYAMQVNVQFTDRLRAYSGDSKERQVVLIEYTNSIFASLGVNYPVTPLLQLASGMVAADFIALFLTQVSCCSTTGPLPGLPVSLTHRMWPATAQITNVVAFLLGLLGVLVIYALVLGDVEAKTYEYGMLRALGMRSRMLVQLLSTQTTFFAMPGTTHHPLSRLSLSGQCPHSKHTSTPTTQACWLASSLAQCCTLAPSLQPASSSTPRPPTLCPCVLGCLAWDWVLSCLPSPMLYPFDGRSPLSCVMPWTCTIR